MSHASESSDPYPFSQVDRAAKPKAALLAGVMGVSTQHAIGSLVEFWDLNGEPRALEAMAAEGKDAIILTAKEAADRWQLASGKVLDPALLAGCGFLEPVEGGYRVRGMSRFFRVAKTRVARRLAGQKGGQASADVRKKDAPTEMPGLPGAEVLVKQTSSKTEAKPEIVAVCSTVAEAKSNLDVRGQMLDVIALEATYVAPVAIVSAPTTDPDSWDGSDFFRWVQSRRLASELPPERPPHPSKLSSWWSSARMVAPTKVLQEAYYRFGDDQYWGKQLPAWPLTAFMSQWDRFLPAGVSYAP